MIIFPALLLASLGLYSLRQDRVLARVEATEQAVRLARELSQSVVPRMLDGGFRELESWDAWRGMTSTTPEGDVLTRLRAAGEAILPGKRLFQAGCLLNDQSELAHPPPLQGMPVPRPLELDELTPAQLSAWFVCEEMWLTGSADPRHLASLVASEVPERFIAVARLKTALSQVQVWETRATGIAELRALLESAPTAVTEMGIPVGDLARLRLATLHGLMPENERQLASDAMCLAILRAPSPHAEAMWETLQAIEQGTRFDGWSALKEMHTQGRELARNVEAGRSLPRLVELRGEECWILERPAKEGRWLVAVSTAGLHELVIGVERAVLKPAHFGVEIRWDRRNEPGRGTAPAILAQESSTMGGVPFQVAVFLSDPEGFDAQREVRARRVMALIGAAVLAVLFGFFAAWRAFRGQQQLSEMKTNFVSSVSHELRAPIASVKLMAEELVDGERPSDEKLAKYHRFIGQECRRLSGVIENVLDFARREQGRERFEFEPTDLSALVTGTVQLLRPYAAEREVTIAEERSGMEQGVEADGQALQRVLVNLLDNAIKHSPQGSTVLVGLEFENTRVSIWVEDDGPGIPRDEQERIFEKFYRIGSELRRQTQGVGLGLSIVKHLTEVHGGRVMVHSNVGEGSRFTVELPLRGAVSPSLTSLNKSIP